MFGGAVIAFLLVPVCRGLEKNMKRPVAAIVVLAAALLAFSAAAALLLPALARQVLQLAEVLPGAFARISGLVEKAGGQMQKYLPGFTLPEVISSIASSCTSKSPEGEYILCRETLFAKSCILMSLFSLESPA